MTAPMTPARLADIEKRVEAATPGPWTVRPELSSDPVAAEATVLHRSGNRDWAVLGCPDCGTNGYGDLADAQLIAHAPADLAALVAEVRRLLGECQAAYHRGRRDGVAEVEMRAILAAARLGRAYLAAAEAWTALGSTDNQADAPQRLTPRREAALATAQSDAMRTYTAANLALADELRTYRQDHP